MLGEHRLRTLFIIPLVLMSLVSSLSWGETLTIDALVEGQKDTVIGHLEVRKLPHNQTIPQSLILPDCVAGRHRCLFQPRLGRLKFAPERQAELAQEVYQHQER